MNDSYVTKAWSSLLRGQLFKYRSLTVYCNILAILYQAWSIFQLALSAQIWVYMFNPQYVCLSLHHSLVIVSLSITLMLHSILLLDHFLIFSSLSFTFVTKGPVHKVLLDIPVLTWLSFFYVSWNDFDCGEKQRLTIINPIWAPLCLLITVLLVQLIGR